MAIESRLLTNKKQWESFLNTRSESNFLQSWNWGVFHERLDQKVIRTGFYDDTKLVGVMLAVVEDAKRGRYLTVPGGPVIDWEDEHQVRAAVDSMEAIAGEQKCVFVRVRPQLPETEKSKAQFKELGFSPAPMHLHAELTTQLDLTQSEDDLLKNMRKKTRYEVRQAKKLGITVAHTNDPSVVKEFYDLQLKTAERHKFVPFSYEYLNEQFSTFAADNEVLMYRADHDGQLLAQAFIIFYGNEAAYHYGASTDAGRNKPGAYAIQWAAIREAKRRGIKRYNFWGVTHVAETKHRFYGVSVFKRGFGGEDVSYLHAHDLVLNKFAYKKNWLIESVRKRIRHV